MPECQCHGLNPDCYLCNGQGWVSEDIIIMKGHGKSTPGGPVHLPVPAKAKQKAKAKRIAKIATKCPYCGNTKIGLKDHIRMKHPEKM